MYLVEGQGELEVARELEDGGIGLQHPVTPLLTSGSSLFKVSDFLVYTVPTVAKLYNYINVL